MEAELGGTGRLTPFELHLSRRRERVHVAAKCLRLAGCSDAGSHRLRCLDGHSLRPRQFHRTAGRAGADRLP